MSRSIDRRLLESLREALPLGVFVETGTFEGDSALLAASMVPRVHTIELSTVLVERARARLQTLPGLQVHQGRPAEVLRSLRPELQTQSAVYWLGAHWCGADDTDGIGAQCPLLEEIEAIGPLNDESVVLIDDARLFLACPPRPHLDEPWPDIHAIFQQLSGLSARHRLLVVNDVIVFCPPRAQASVRRYAQEHGVEWADVYRHALDREKLRAELLVKDQAIKYWWTMASRTWTRRVRVNARLAARTAREHLPRPVIEGIKRVLPSRLAGTRVLSDEAIVPPKPLDSPVLFEATGPSSARVVVSPASRTLGIPPTTGGSARHERAGARGPVRIKCMTFPRSGHGLLARMLRHYFNDGPGSRQNGLYVSDAFTYCSNYGHCRAHPCSDPRTNFQKDHDFQLDTPVSASMEHVVQYRHPINSLMSWYLFALAHKDIAMDSRTAWEAFARRKIEYWKWFVDKWVLGPVPNRVVIRYEELMEQPEDRLVAALQAFGDPVDEARARFVVRAMNVGHKNRASDFRYFDRSYNALICRLASAQLQALGYDPDDPGSS